MNRKDNKKIRKRKTLVESRRTLAQFNLSKIIFVIAIIVILVTVSTVSVITIDAHKKNALAGEEQDGAVTWVESSDLDEDGNPIKVPVPKGYTASQIPGETSAKNGFVIYEGDVDWDSVLSDTPTTETTIETMSNEDTTLSKENTNEEIIEDNNENIEQSEEEISENEVVEENEAEQNEVVEEDTENIENSGENQEENIDEEKNETIEENVVEEETEQTEQEVQNENEISNEITEDENTETQETTKNTESSENGIELLAEGDEEITQEDINIFNLQKSVNQYV